ncbi:MAG: hypothetical protein HRT65_05735 [Flavobacteriaceae bacterium]|nr:hypothetical protein [Flavobacteriaceae bacterium]
MAKRSQIEDRLVDIMEKGQHFSDTEFSLSKLANPVGVSNKELFDHINTVHKSNVSYYINHFWVEKVKALMDKPEIPVLHP